MDRETLARWEYLGLLRATDGRYDFRDLVSLRVLRRLLDDGVRSSVIATSLARLAALVPGVERPLAQLRLVADGPDRLLADLGACRVAPDGQLFLAFAPPAPSAEVAGRILPEEPSADAWFALGQTHEAAGALVDAAEAYRAATAADPAFVEAHFNRAVCLERLGQIDAARTHWAAYLVLDPRGPWASVARRRLDRR